MQIPVTDAGRIERRKILETIRRAGVAKAILGPQAANSQDFLYDDNGMPHDRMDKISDNIS